MYASSWQQVSLSLLRGNRLKFSTRQMLYSVYAALNVCCTVIAVLSVCCTRDRLYWIYVLRTVCCARFQLMIMVLRDRVGWLNVGLCNDDWVVDKTEWTRLKMRTMWRILVVNRNQGNDFPNCGGKTLHCLNSTRDRSFYMLYQGCQIGSHTTFHN
jgi:hypothetical protein